MENYQKRGFERTCKYCGERFFGGKKREYCSKRCKDIVSRQRRGIACNPNPKPYEKTCVICGSAFQTFREAQVTCSSDCAVKYHRRNRKNRFPKVCDVCSASFIPRSSVQKTCGDPMCQKTHKKEYNKAHPHSQKHSRKAINIVLAECEYCGNVFFSEETSRKKYCSKECSRKAGNQHRDKRIPREQRIDKINLRRLYKRDGGKCYICGCDCSFDDWQTAKNGNKYPGISYPTIDHVVPVSKGGLDSWDNVRLACWRCNIEKSDTLTDSDGLEPVFAYSQKWTPNNKQTAQYTLDGQLVKVWDSTAQIRRELGLNDKHIQNVCSRRTSNTGNAYGFHWEYINGRSAECR